MEEEYIIIKMDLFMKVIGNLVNVMVMVYIYNDGSRYDGMWYNGQKHTNNNDNNSNDNNSRYLYTNGDELIGTWVDGVLKGPGTYKCSKGM